MNTKSFFLPTPSPELQTLIHNCLPSISTWISSRHLKVNIYKTKLFLQCYCLPISSQTAILLIFIKSVDTKIHNCCKSLNLVLDCGLLLIFYIPLFSNSSQFAFINVSPFFSPLYHRELEHLTYKWNYYSSILS